MFLSKKWPFFTYLIFVLSAPKVNSINSIPSIPVFIIFIQQPLLVNLQRDKRNKCKQRMPHFDNFYIFRCDIFNYFYSLMYTFLMGLRWTSGLAPDHMLPPSVWVPLPQVTVLKTCQNMTLSVEWDLKPLLC